MKKGRMVHPTGPYKRDGMDAVCACFVNSQNTAGNPLTVSGLRSTAEAWDGGSVPGCVGHGGFFFGEQLRQDFFRAQMMRLALIELFFRVYA